MTNYIRYHNFKCKDANITTHTPINVYIFNDSYDVDTYNLITPYNGEYYDSMTRIDTDHTRSVKIYPIGSTFQIKELYGHCSFSAGCFDDFVVKAEDGLYMWINASDVNAKECIFDYGYNTDLYSQDLNATNKERVKKDSIKRFYSQVKSYSPHEDYLKIIDFFNKNSQNNSPTTLTVYLSKYNAEDNRHKYFYRYVLNIIERYFPKKLSYRLKLVLLESPNEIRFTLNTPKKSYNFLPYSCKAFIKNPYACFKNFQHWIEKPYEAGSIIYDSILTQDILNKAKYREHFIVVKTEKDNDFDHIVRLYHYLEKIKSNTNNATIYKAKKNISNHFIRDGIYIIDSNMTILEFGEFYSNDFIRKSKYYFNKTLKNIKLAIKIKKDANNKLQYK